MSISKELMLSSNIIKRQTVIVSKNLAVSNIWRENLFLIDDFSEVIVRNVAHSGIQGAAPLSHGSYIVRADFIDTPQNVLCTGTLNNASDPQNEIKVTKKTNDTVSFAVFTRQANDAFATPATNTVGGILYITLEFIKYEKK
jgi:hypothetical protein